MSGTPHLDPAPAEDALVAAALRVVSTRPTSGSGEELVTALRRVGELRRLVEAEGIRLAAELDRACRYEGPDAPDRTRGFTGPIPLIEAVAGVDKTDAAAWIRVGHATRTRVELSGAVCDPDYPILADAVAAGQVGAVAADAIVRALNIAARTTDRTQTDQFEEALTQAAPHLPIRQLRQLCRHVTEAACPDGTALREDELRRRAGVTIRQLPDGMTRLIADLHPEAAGYVVAALDARTAPRREPTFTAEPLIPVEDGTDRRPLTQKRVDALVGIARDALTHDPGHVAGAPVTVMVTVAMQDLLDGLGTARISGIDQPISAKTARRLAADAGIIPAVLGTRSENLDQGRMHRVATPAQRRALDLRDQGCIWPGCDAPPGWCEVAHLIAWIHDGPTDLANLALMCARHHRLFDSDHWELRWRDGTPWLIPPPHVDHLRTPLRAGQPTLTGVA